MVTHCACGPCRISHELVASAGLLTNSASSVATDVSAQAPSNQNDPLATQPNKDDPFGIRNFNCADIAQYGIDKQMNVRAAAIMAKCSGKSEGNTNSGDTSGLLAPLQQQSTQPYRPWAALTKTLSSPTVPTLQPSSPRPSHGTRQHSRRQLQRLTYQR